MTDSSLDGYDLSDMWLLEDREFVEFLFPDAQITLHRLGHKVVTKERVSELMQAVNPLDRQVPRDSLAQVDFWASLRDKAEADDSIETVS